MKPREFWIPMYGADTVYSAWSRKELAEHESKVNPPAETVHVREVQPNEPTSHGKCDLCGSPVKVVGDTTKHYEPDPDYKALAQELVKALEVAYKTFHILCVTSLSSANLPPALEMMSEAIDRARKAGIE